MSALSDLGPTLPSAGDLRFTAIEARQLAALIIELTTDGPQRDLVRAAAKMKQLRAVVGAPADQGESA